MQVFKDLFHNEVFISVYAVLISGVFIAVFIYGSLNAAYENRIKARRVFLFIISVVFLLALIEPSGKIMSSVAFFSMWMFVGSWFGMLLYTGIDSIITAIRNRRNWRSRW